MTVATVGAEAFGDALAAQMAALERELFGKGAWSERSIRQELDAPARTYRFIASDGDAQGTPELLAYAGFWFDGDDAELMTIGVAPHAQRRGLAAALMEDLIARAAAQGARRMLLEVRVDNAPAIALYERFGFTRMGLRKRYYQPEGIDAYTMSLELSPRIAGFASKAFQA